ncbi:hypothetical protein, partial [Caballeronia sp. GAOx1]|uniref:hypothetical protein n=1 Tax=Caballeronia sp. GAOx1 TaxID=2921761 RepID=UPI002027AE35
MSNHNFSLPLNFKLRLRILTTTVFLILIMQHLHAQPAPYPRGPGFGVTRLSGTQNGSNGVGVWMDGTVQIGLSDTIISDVVGIGVTRTQISRDDLLEARNRKRSTNDAAQSKVLERVMCDSEVGQR